MEISKSCSSCKYTKLLLDAIKYCNQCGSILEVESSKTEELITFCCWIGNISTDFSNSFLENHFDNDGRQFGRVHSIRIEFSKQRGKNQCYINYYEEKSMRKAVDFFNEKLLQGLKLLAQPRLPKHAPKPDTSRIYEDSILILNSKYLRKQLAKKIETVKSIYGPSLSIELEGNNSSNFTIHLKTSDMKVFDQINQIIKNHWIVLVEELDFSSNGKKSVLKFNEDFIKIGYKYDCWVQIEESKIYVFSFVKNDSKSALNECTDLLQPLATDNGKTFCCWIGNIPTTIDDLKGILSKEAIKFGKFSSIKIDFNSKYKVNQCHINYFDDESANNAAEYFNKRKFFGFELKSKKKI